MREMAGFDVDQNGNGRTPGALNNWTAATTPFPARKAWKIVIVDDDPAVCNSLKFSLAD
jgi:hypothetical protein